MKRGFTFVELLVSIAVMSIIAGLDVMLLQTGMEVWTHAGTRLSLQKAADELMENLLEGGLEGEGIRDAVELKQADLTAVGFVPLWTDKSHKPGLLHNKEQRFVLDRQFKAGSPTPIGQVRKEGTKDFVVVPVKFTYGSGQDPKAPDDVVQFIDPIPTSSEIRILYTPDVQNDPDAAKVFRWESATWRIYESYAGKTRDILLHGDAVKVERCAFLYYDNLNRLLAFGEGKSLSSLALRRAMAVKIYLFLRLGSETKELTSFTNVRNVASIGATVTEGAQLPMPSPGVIKAFSLGDFYGFKREGLVQLLVKTRPNRSWAIQLKFKQGAKPDGLVLEKFQIESPRGKILTSGILDQEISSHEFVSLQAIDRTGLYDYDLDEGVKGQLEITGDNPTVTVTRLDFEGASLFIRP